MGFLKTNMIIHGALSAAHALGLGELGTWIFIFICMHVLNMDDGNFAEATWHLAGR